MTPVQRRRRVRVRTSQSPVTHGEVHEQKGGCDTIHWDFFFFFLVCMYCVFPIAARLTRSAPALRPPAGQEHPEDEGK